MPIPVPMPGTHQHGAAMMMPQQGNGQPMPQAHMQAPLSYSHQALTIQGAPGYPAGVAGAQMSMEPQAQANLGVMHMIGPEEYMNLQSQ